MDASSSDAASGKDIAGKREHADSFKSNNLPGARCFRHWKKKLRKVIAKACGWPSECCDWMIDAGGDPGKSSVRNIRGNIFKGLHRSGQFPHICSAIDISLDDIIPPHSPLDFKVDYLEGLLGRQQPVQMLKGRQTYRLALGHYNIADMEMRIS